MKQMKSTKVQNPRRIHCMHRVKSCMPIHMRGNWPRLAITRGAAVSYLAPTRASGIVLGKAECC